MVLSFGKNSLFGYAQYQNEFLSSETEAGLNGPIKSIQYGNINIPNGDLTNTATITAVNTSNSILIFLGTFYSDSGGDSWDNTSAILDLTNGVTVTATRGDDGDGSLTHNFCILEFDNGYIKSKQTGTIFMDAGDSSNTATVAAVTKGVLFYSGVSNTVTSVDVEDAQYSLCRLDLTNTTTITASRQSLAYTATVGYQLIDFN